MEAYKNCHFNVVEIDGAVRLPGKYPLLSDSSLGSLISLAGGFDTSAYLESVEITRLTFGSTGRAEVSTFPVALSTARTEDDFDLMPLDRVRVSQMPNWSYGDQVQITGAVEFPGFRSSGREAVQRVGAGGRRDRKWICAGGCAHQG